jgi:hypothetical protein
MAGFARKQGGEVASRFTRDTSGLVIVAGGTIAAYSGMLETLYEKSSGTHMACFA